MRRKDGDMVEMQQQKGGFGKEKLKTAKAKANPKLIKII
jgi:hypothetical protein